MILSTVQYSQEINYIHVNILHFLGPKYIAGRAVVAVKATHTGLKFGKLLEIIVVNRIEPFVKFRLYETEGYDHSMGAVPVQCPQHEHCGIN